MRWGLTEACLASSCRAALKRRSRGLTLNVQTVLASFNRDDLPAGDGERDAPRTADPSGEKVGTRSDPRLSGGRPGQVRKPEVHQHHGGFALGREGRGLVAAPRDADHRQVFLIVQDARDRGGEKRVVLHHKHPNGVDGGLVHERYVDQIRLDPGGIWEKASQVRLVYTVTCVAVVT